ncbi:TraR/DksA C4-type zinc finger protein [Methylomonas sp. SURF-1]|uniref:TraR/DksA C4-type zinc finger protein n=1 Tax=Methylomonas aurea TaxID=2952224 RepID=A0ABT1UHL0_9GAMM|nr:TraR/DksA C4-type zinc finger protein [Methylomonas sp. SURF-1]MCQ8181723.1 TraR/DksA C4-type zinc finger protein [Methylomonas sp. SURF-1]
MSTAWAGGADAIAERMEKMTELFVAETRKAIYTGESASDCEECGEPIPEARRAAIPCKYCLPCQTSLEQTGKNPLKIR